MNDDRKALAFWISIILISAVVLWWPQLRSFFDSNPTAPYFLIVGLLIPFVWILSRQQGGGKDFRKPSAQVQESISVNSAIIKSRDIVTDLWAAIVAVIFGLIFLAFVFVIFTPVVLEKAKTVSAWISTAIVVGYFLGFLGFLAIFVYLAKDLLLTFKLHRKTKMKEIVFQQGILRISVGLVLGDQRKILLKSRKEYLEIPYSQISKVLVEPARRQHRGFVDALFHFVLQNSSEIVYVQRKYFENEQAFVEELKAQSSAPVILNDQLK